MQLIRKHMRCTPIKKSASHSAFYGTFFKCAAFNEKAMCSVRIS